MAQARISELKTDIRHIQLRIRQQPASFFNSFLVDVFNGTYSKLIIKIAIKRSFAHTGNISQLFDGDRPVKVMADKLNGSGKTALGHVLSIISQKQIP